MSMKTDLAELKGKLTALKDRIENDDEEALKEAEGLKASIEAKTAEIEKAEKKAAILSAIGIETEENEMELNLEELKATKGTRTFDMKAYNDTHTKPTVTVVDQNVVDIQPTLAVRSAFGAESINGNALTFYKITGMDGTIGTVNEGAKKGQVHINDTSVTVALLKIAAFIKETDELLSDGAFLDSALRGRLKYEFDKAVEAYAINALTATSGVQVGESSITFDNLLKAKQDVRTNTGYAADTIMINPADLETLLLTKDINYQYLLGGPAYGSYGNGAYAANPRIWGMNVIESAAVPEGQAIVGAFKAGASLVTKAGEGQRVEVSNSDQDDFVYNRVTVRIEERMVLAVRVPAAFVLVGTTASSSSD